MSQFSTGELAKAAEVSVRTVQYYDQRGILTPSEVTEGGRRIYHESDLERLQVICFLRDLDFSINQIKKLLQEENREQVLELLLTDQIESLEKSSKEIEVKLKRARHLQKATAKRHQLFAGRFIRHFTSYGKSKIMASFAVENVWECRSNLPSLSDGPTGCHLLF